MKKILSTDRCPKAVGPYSQGVKINNLIFMSGQIPLNPETNELVENDIKKQTIQVLNNINDFVTSFDLTMENIVKTTIFVQNMADFNTINEIYSKYFVKEPPARSLVEVSALPKNVLIEIECIVSAE